MYCWSFRYVNNTDVFYLLYLHVGNNMKCIVFNIFFNEFAKSQRLYKISYRYPNDRQFVWRIRLVLNIFCTEQRKISACCLVYLEINNPIILTVYLRSVVYR